MRRVLIIFGDNQPAKFTGETRSLGYLHSSYSEMDPARPLSFKANDSGRKNQSIDRKIQRIPVSPEKGNYIRNGKIHCICSPLIFAPFLVCVKPSQSPA